MTLNMFHVLANGSLGSPDIMASYLQVKFGEADHLLEPQNKCKYLEEESPGVPTNRLE